MNAIAIELDKQLQSLDPETAASVEQLVRDTLQLASRKQANGSTWPPGFWQKIREDWGDEPSDFEPLIHADLH